MCPKAVNTNDNFTTPSSLITKIISVRKAEKLSERNKRKCVENSRVFFKEKGTNEMKCAIGIESENEHPVLLLAFRLA